MGRFLGMVVLNWAWTCALIVAALGCSGRPPRDRGGQEAPEFLVVGADALGLDVTGRAPRVDLFDIDDDGFWWIERHPSDGSTRLRCTGRADRAWRGRGGERFYWTAKYAVTSATSGEIRFVPKSGGNPIVLRSLCAPLAIQVDPEGDRLWGFKDGRLVTFGPTEVDWSPAEVLGLSRIGWDAGESIPRDVSIIFGLDRFAVLARGSLVWGRRRAGTLHFENSFALPEEVRRIQFNGRDPRLPISWQRTGRREDVLLAWTDRSLWAIDLARREAMRWPAQAPVAFFDRGSGDLRIPPGQAGMTPAPPVREGFLDVLVERRLAEMGRHEREGHWEEIFDLYEKSRRRPGEVALPTGESGRESYVPRDEFLRRRLSRLRPEAFVWYRERQDSRARAAFSAAFESGCLDQLEEAVDNHFFASDAGGALNRLAHELFDQGRAAEAAFHWSRLLWQIPDCAVPRTVTAARLAHARATLGDVAGLDELAQRLRKEGIVGQIRVGHRPADLGDYIEFLKAVPRDSTQVPVRMPARWPWYESGMDLLSLVEPPKDVLRGSADRGGNGLTLSSGSLLQIRCAPPEEYDLLLGVERLRERGKLVVGLSTGERQFDIVIDNLHGGEHRTGLHRLDGLHVTRRPDARKGMVFTNVTPHLVLVSVRKGTIAVSVDSVPVLEWEGSFDRLSLDPVSRVPDPSAFSLGTNHSVYRIRTAELVPVSARLP